MYSLYEEDGDNKRSGLFSKSFHYFTFQINQALSFNTYDLKRAIFALKRSLEDFKEFSQQDQMKLPEHFLWGVLSFIKSILQVVNRSSINNSDPNYNFMLSFFFIPF